MRCKTALRDVCYRCRKAQVMCYCGDLRPFASDPIFVILIHPKESRKAINTGRMAFLSITNSILLVGDRFDDNSELRSILQNPRYRCMILFPGPEATELKDLAPTADRQDVFIILDATWAMAKKMFKSSRCLSALPLVAFTPSKPSGFAIRQQPAPECYSTIETIHHILEKRGCHPSGEHNSLLQIFETMVQKQIDFENSNP